MAKARGTTTQLHNMFVADFETTDSDSVYKVDSATGEPIHNQRVWLAGHKNLETMESEYFYNLDDFMNDILSRKNNTHREYAFHNIKFDGSYIIPWLFANDFIVSLSKPQPGQFSILVDDRNNWYNITIQVTTRRKVTLWDSLKLFPTALQYLPDIYTTPTKKIREDSDFYTKNRPEDYIPDERDITYFENDLQVPAEVLNKHIELYDLRFKKTQASQAFYNFEQIFPNWRWRFVALDTEVDNVIRPSYWGGISYVPPEKAGEDFYGVNVADINSSYPDKAANSKLPYGKPLHQYGEGKHPDMSKFWIAEAIVEFKLKDKNKIPCIPSKSISEGRPMVVEKWMDDSKGLVKMTFSNIDYETIQDSYDFEVVRWKWSIHWAWKVHREVAKFVNMNNENKVKYSALAKQAKDEGNLQLAIEYKTIANRAKIDNNSFYGKFGEEIIKQGKTPYDEEDEEGNQDIIWKTDREDEASEYNKKFLPVAIAITAWGRQQLVHTANKLGKYFLYCDTDSVHYLKEGGQQIIAREVSKGKMYMHPTDLGAWDFEGYYVRGRFLRAKAYMEETPEGEMEVTLAGLPADKHSGQFSKKRSAISWDYENNCTTWDKFHLGHIVTAEESNKLRTIRTATGNKLVPVAFQIKEKDTALNTIPKQLQTT